MLELIREHAKQVDDLRAHLADVHDDYAARFDALAKQAAEM